MELEYPYMKLHKDFSIIDFCDNLKKFKINILFDLPNELKNSNIEKFQDKYFIIKDNYKDTININSLTDYFTEKWRIQCFYKGKPSPLKYWTENKDKIISLCKKKFKKITIYNLRETIYQNAKICNNFKISVILSVLSYFKPTSWLDISAGWGDRLIGAILSKYIKYYESTDPNLSLHKGYTDIIDTFVLPKNRKQYIIHNTGFLEASLLKNNFDFIFSSPPFFDLENYSTFTNDSITKFNNNKSWVDNFLIPSLKKCYDYLNVNGIMIIYIHSEKYLDEKIKEFDNIMTRLGSIYFYDTKPRRMYVWKK